MVAGSHWLRQSSRRACCVAGCCGVLQRGHFPFNGQGERNTIPSNYARWGNKSSSEHFAFCYTTGEDRLSRPARRARRRAQFTSLFRAWAHAPSCSSHNAKPEKKNSTTNRKEKHCHSLRAIASFFRCRYLARFCYHRSVASALATAQQTPNAP